MRERESKTRRRGERERLKMKEEPKHNKSIIRMKNNDATIVEVKSE